MQIRVIKSDGSTEPYLHTKVFGSLHRAMAVEVSDCIETAQILSDAVTYFLYRRSGPRSLTTDQIHQMILTVLEGAGFRYAAECLNAHRLNRRLERHRIEVIDSEFGAWDKQHIIRELTEQYNIEPSLARAIAGSVEDTVLRMGVLHIRKGMIRHLVMTDMENMLDAQHQLADSVQPSSVL
jgi:transcriptional regulator NrdR family protein